MQNNISTCKGYGDAIIQGIQSVETKFFCIFNADGSFDPKEINLMIDKLNHENLDLIFGSRYEKKIAGAMMILL